MLVLGLLSINSFILINISYTDLITILDEKDTQQIEGVQLYTNLQSLIMTDVCKDATQYARNLIQNLRRKPEFVDVLVRNGFDYKKYLKKSQTGGYSDCNNGNSSNRNCIVYHRYSNGDDTMKFIEMQNIMANSLILINNSLEMRLYNYTEFPMNKQFTYSSIEFMSTWVFPYNEISANITNLKNWTGLHNELVKRYFEYYYNSEIAKAALNPIRIEEYTQQILNSPFNSGLPYWVVPRLYSLNRTRGALFYTFISANLRQTSFSSNSSYNEVLIFLNNTSNLVDFVSFEVDADIVDYYTFDLTNVFRGIRVFVHGSNETRIANSPLISSSTCNYFRKLYNLNNKEENHVPINQNDIFPNLLECFPYNIGKEYFNKTFFRSTYNQYYVKRRVKIPAVNFNQDGTEENSIYYKVFKNQSPDPYVTALVNTDYFTLRQSNIYVLKNERFMDVIFKHVYFKFIGVMFMILFFNFIFWYLLLVVIYVLLFNVTSSLTKPINVLCRLVTSIGKEENPESKEDWNFVYSDDQDIKELFELCKNLIKGGFSDNSNKLKDKKLDNAYLNNAYNNISYVKTNNLIIEEDKIELGTNASADTIFSYKRSGQGEKSNLFIVTHKEFDINNAMESSKDTATSRDRSGSLYSRKKANDGSKEKKINFSSQKEALVYSYIDEYQQKRNSEKDQVNNSMLFELFRIRNGDVRAFSID